MKSVSTADDGGRNEDGKHGQTHGFSAPSAAQCSLMEQVQISYLPFLSGAYALWNFFLG